MCSKTQGTGWTNEDTQLAADTIPRTGHPRQRAIHLQALRRADLNALAAAGAARLIEQRQLGKDHDSLSFPSTGFSNPATTSGSISAGCGKSMT